MADPRLDAMSSANPMLAANLEAGQHACDVAGINWGNILQNLPQVISLLGQLVTILKAPPQ